MKWFFYVFLILFGRQGSGITAEVTSVVVPKKANNENKITSALSLDFGYQRGDYILPVPMEIL